MYMLTSVNIGIFTTHSAFSRDQKLRGVNAVNISAVILALSFHFLELMMMIPIVEQLPSTLEPVLMLATLFKTGETTFQHAVCFLIFYALCAFVNFRLILVLRISPNTHVIDAITLVNLRNFQNANFFERGVNKVDLQLPCLPIAADKCDDSFVHRDCISCCPPTCTFEKQCLGSNLHCLDGCYCPDGKCFMNEMISALMETSIQ